jgi:O-antigen ligase
LSVVVLVVDPYNAWQAATRQYPRRFQGFEQNPNTGPMLLALGVPLACWWLIDAGSSRTRAAAVLVLGLFAAIIIASGSRGALAAAAVSLAVLVPVGGRTRGRRAGFAVAAAAGIAAAVLLSQIPKARPAPQGVPAQPAAAVQAPRDAEHVLPLEDEKGRPAVGRRARPFRRRLLDVNGRLRPVLGAFGEGAQRPVAGYGFGMERRVFVDRYYGFYSAVAENSYAGLFLQLGAAGLGLFALTFGAVLVAAISARRRLDEPGRRLTTVTAAAVVGGLVLGLTQSYVYAVGNIATVAMWCGAALLAAAAARPAAPD